ncbi:Protein MSP1 AltName: Full=Tat-binding homolog 4 [Rhizoctonia solani AG-1 IB]|nr:Protein MSP1 AltName: Full=Tat-binding homolog 4 [Rhizoctonia solani AG-1 IB]
MSGALLFGPPGTGKTLLAKAIAKESGARMLSIKPSDILEKCVGEDEKNIRALFKLARRLKPCVIFIDEADALFGARISAKQEKSARWRTDMLTQFTQEMDGMLSSDVTVICATNRPFDLDDAIIRRLPCRMLVDLPDTAARKAILGILLREENLGADVDLMELANQTPQFSGSDLKHVCVMAAYESAKELANISWNDKKGKKPDSSISLVSGLSLVPPESGIRQADEPVASGSETGKDKEPTSDKARIREIGKRHFAHALGQVRASTSETQNSLVELRRWDQKFGSSSHSNRSAGLAIPGASLPVSGKPWMNGVGTNAPGAGTGGMYGSDMYGSGTHGPGMYGNGMYGMGTSMSYMSEMGAQGMNGMTRNPADANYVAPPPGSYLKSLGVQFEPMY